MFISATSRRSVRPVAFAEVTVEFQRKIPISKVKAATKSTMDGCMEFIVHVK